MKRVLFSAAALGLLSAAPLRANQIDDLTAKVDSLVTRESQMESDIASLKAQLAIKNDLTAAPATQGAAVSMAKFNRAGPWEVQVISVVTADVGTIDSQLRDEQTNQANLTRQANRARANYDGMVASQHTRFDNGSQQYVTSQTYHTNELNTAGGKAQTLENELRDSKAKVAKLQRQLDDAQNNATAIATSSDGTTLPVTGEGIVAKALVQQMSVGRRYKVEGSSVMSDGKLTIKVRTVTPLD